MENYLNILDNILRNGTWKQNRTGIDTISISGAMFEHDMSKGFPLLTTKEMQPKSILSELEFFISGRTDKEWLRKNKNRIWDDWCNPDALSKYSFLEENIETEFKEIMSRTENINHKKMKRIDNLIEKANEYFNENFELKNKPDSKLIDVIKKLAQYSENDLGPIYGWQWRHFGGSYKLHSQTSNPEYENYENEGIDQLKYIIDGLKNNPESRRLICNSWNPLDIERMALPPCHYGFQILSDGENIDLIWQQRSVDTALGLPYNIASYATLLHLLSKESNLIPRKLIGQLGDVHIYKNQLKGVKKQLSREPRELPEIITDNFESIFDWNYQDTSIVNYKPHPKIKFDIAV